MGTPSGGLHWENSRSA